MDEAASNLDIEAERDLHTASNHLSRHHHPAHRPPTLHHPPRRPHRRTRTRPRHQNRHLPRPHHPRRRTATPPSQSRLTKPANHRRSRPPVQQRPGATRAGPINPTLHTPQPVARAPQNPAVQGLSREPGRADRAVHRGGCRPQTSRLAGWIRETAAIKNAAQAQLGVTPRQAAAHERRPDQRDRRRAGRASRAAPRR